MSKEKENPLANLKLSTIVLYLKRHTYLTVAVASWGVMGILTLGVLIPQINLISDHNQKLTIEEKKLSDLQTRSTFLTSLNSQELTDEASVLQKVLPSQKPVMPLISSIEKLASDANVSLQSFELTPGVVATEGATPSLQTMLPVKGIVEGVGPLPLKMEVQGGFAQMNTFFKTLDVLIPLINVRTIEFTVLSQNRSALDPTTRYKATIELDSLYALPGSGKIDPSPVLTALNTQERSLMASLSAAVSNQPQLGQMTFAPVATSSSQRQTIFSY